MVMPKAQPNIIYIDVNSQVYEHVVMGHELNHHIASQAMILDAEFNIRDNQGSVKDYVKYFTATGITESSASDRSLLRGVGKSAFAIARSGGDTVIAGLNASTITATEAERIALAAPNDDALQSLGVNAIVNKGKSADYAINLMAAVSTSRSDADTTDTNTFDLFGFDDSAMREAEAMADTASRKQNELKKLRGALKVGSKAEKLQGLTGGSVSVKIENKEQLKNAIADLDSEIIAWDNWATNPALTKEIRDSIAGKESSSIPVVEDDDTRQDDRNETLVGEATGLLSNYTNQEILQHQEAEKARKKEKEKSDSKFDQKHRADLEIDSFADEMMGKGGTTTKSLFDIVELPKRKSVFDADSTGVKDVTPTYTNKSQARKHLQQVLKAKTEELVKSGELEIETNWAQATFSSNKELREFMFDEALKVEGSGFGFSATRFGKNLAADSMRDMVFNDVFGFRAEGAIEYVNHLETLAPINAGREVRFSKSNVQQSPLTVGEINDYISKTNNALQRAGHEGSVGFIQRC